MDQTPTIGTGCTLKIGSDSYAYTIIAVERGGKTITVQRDKVTLAALAGSQPVHQFSPDPNGYTEQFTLRQNGEYRAKGKNHTRLVIGTRKENVDYYR